MEDNQKLETAPLQTQDTAFLEQDTQDTTQPAAKFLPINPETKLPYGAVAFTKEAALIGYTVVTRLGEVVKLSEDMRFSDTRGKSVDFEWYVQDDGTILGHIECDSDVFIYNDELAFQQQYPRNFEPAPELAEPTPQLTHLQMVEQFHSAFSHPIAETPNIPDVETMRFRLDFLREEISELEQAAHAIMPDGYVGDLHAFADAIVDIQYVLDGLILNSGLQKHMPALVAEVHRANMAKLHQDDYENGFTALELATKTAVFHKEKGMGCGIHGSSDGSGWIVKRNDGKILKPIDWKEPDFSAILPLDGLPMGDQCPDLPD